MKAIAKEPRKAESITVPASFLATILTRGFGAPSISPRAREQPFSSSLDPSRIAAFIESRREDDRQPKTQNCQPTPTVGATLSCTP